MDISFINPETKIARIQKSLISMKRLRWAGCNARVGVHGIDVNFPCVRITADGVDGFGWSRLTEEKANAFIGMRIVNFFDEEGLIKDEYIDMEYALLDWLGAVSEKPVYRLFAEDWFNSGENLSVPCYDSTLYFDELHIKDDNEAAEFMQREALEGQARGHTSFKVKVGRGNLHMPLEEGMRRDILIIKKIREALGPEAEIMVDANNGFNLSLTKMFLEATADYRLYWIEEPFYEDNFFYENLKAWLANNKLNILIADGEGGFHPRILEWAEKGLIDVIQHDVNFYGYCKWIKVGRRLDKAGVLSAPHNYNCFFGNFTAAHLVSSIKGFVSAEMDECISPGILSSGYDIREGRLHVPGSPGFGLSIDTERYFNPGSVLF